METFRSKFLPLPDVFFCFWDISKVFLNGNTTLETGSKYSLRQSFYPLLGRGVKIGQHMTCWLTLHCVKKKSFKTTWILIEINTWAVFVTQHLKSTFWFIWWRHSSQSLVLPYLDFYHFYLFTQNHDLSLTLPKRLKILTMVGLPGVETIDKNNNKWNVLTVNSWETHLI